MKVSIIVPFYNVEPYFRRCLDSIVNQSYRDLEIILVDDCSPDNSLAIAKEYADKDDRITIIRHEVNKGLGGARNSGFAQASGEYVWFIDSDDEISTPYTVEHLLLIAKRDDSDVILFRAQGKFLDHKQQFIYGDYVYMEEQVFNDQRPFYPVYLDVILKGINEYAGFTPSSCMKFFKISFIQQYHFKFLEHTLHEDIPILVLLASARCVTQLPYIFYDYYQREQSIMHTKVLPDYIEHFERVAGQMWEMYDRYLKDYERSKEIVPVLLVHHLWYNTRRVRDSLTLKQYQLWVCDLYDFLKLQLFDRVGVAELRTLPSHMGNQGQWQAVFRSFQQVSVDDRKKIKLIDDMITGKRKKNLWKKVVKMLLPYGFTRLIQKTRKH